MEDLRNKIYLVNRLGEYFCMPYKGKKLVFEYNKPVLIDYAKDRGLLLELLQNPTLGICTVEEVEAMIAAAKPKVEIKEPEAVENEESVTDELAEEE